MDHFVVSARKYRPLGFEEVVGQEHITTTLKNAIDNKKLAQALLFCGPRGVGKTTCARIVARMINGFEEKAELNSLNIFELDAASNNSVEDIRSLIEQVQPAIEQLDREAAASGAIGPTFFEVTTAMAFLHFAQAKVDAAVLEVGLGGRLDSTNVCRPEVCIVTSISFDHTRQLGGTLALIAGEKAGIIKPGIPVVSGVLDLEPREVIVERATAAGAPLIQCGVDYGFSTPHSAPGYPRSGSRWLAAPATQPFQTKNPPGGTFSVMRC